MSPTDKLSERPVALVTTSLAGGGAERNWLNLAGGLVERGFAVDVVTLAVRGQLRSVASTDVRFFGSENKRCDQKLLQHLHQHYRYHDLQVGAFERLVAWLGYRCQWPRKIRNSCTSRIAKEAALVRAYIQCRNPRALLATQNPANRAAIMARESTRSDAMVSVTIQNNVLMRYSPVDKKRARFLYPKADAVVGISRGVVNDIVEQLGLERELVRCIYNGIPVQQIMEASFADSRLKGGSFPYDVPVVLSAMRLTGSDGQKDHDTLLRAFALVRANTPSKLVLIGGSSRRSSVGDRILRLANELGVGGDVVLWGFDENPYPYMRAASVLVQSSRWEGFANVIVEAMACGTPVVSTDAPFGPAEILDSGRFGSLVPIGDEHRMAEAIKEVLAGNHLPSDALKERAREFSLSRAAEEYERLILRGRHPGSGEDRSQ